MATTPDIDESDAGPLAPLRIRDFRLLLVMQFASGIRQPMQFFMQAWYVNVAAPEGQRVLLLGLLATGQGLAYLLYVLFGGAFADRFPRRSMLMVTHVLGFVALVGTALLLYLPGARTGEGVWLPVMMLLFTEFGIMLAQDLPARTAMVPEAVPAHMHTRAATIHWLIFPLAFLMAAPSVGWTIEHLGFGTTYLIAAGGHLVVLAALWRMSTRAAPADASAAGDSLMENVIEGMRYMRGEPQLLWTVVITWLSLASGMTAMGILIAAWVQDILGLDAAGWGRMALFWGLGGLVTSAALTYVGEFGRKGPLFIISTALFGIAVLGFAFSRSLVVSAGFFVVAGAGFQTMVTVNTAIAQQITPNRLLGRVMSMLWMAQGIARTSGVVIGAVGQLIGLPLLYPLIGALMLGVALLATLQRPLRRLD